MTLETPSNVVTLPAAAGTSFKPAHFAAISQDAVRPCPALHFFEVHSENYFHQGRADHAQLEAIAAQFPLSLHGVGMNLGSASGLDRQHLQQLKQLIDRYNPAAVSDHIAWVGTPDRYLNDLLPLPYTEEALDLMVANISMAQDFLDRRILVENPSTYLTFTHSTIDEADFVIEVARRSGAGLLLDLNNVYVNACNHGFDAAAWIAKVPTNIIGEVHLAGHTIRQVDGIDLRIDDHGSKVQQDVWTLYANLISRAGPLPTLIEWDTDLPDWQTLKAEALTAARIMSAEQLLGAAHA